MAEGSPDSRAETFDRLRSVRIEPTKGTNLVKPSEAREHSGIYGTAVKMDVPDIPEMAETVCHWLITAPAYHPAWSQYLLVVVRLRDLPGWPEPYLQFPGATHELIVITLDPDHGPYTADLPQKYATGGLPHLTPINVAEQIEGTDAEAEELASLGAWAIVTGRLEPESSNGPERIRAGWKASMVKTLAHIRGEEHAS